MFQDPRVVDPRNATRALDEAVATLGLPRAVATVVAWTIQETKDQTVEVPRGLTESLRIWLRCVDVREPSGRRVDLAWMSGEDCSLTMDALGGMVRALGCATMRVGPVTDPRMLIESVSRNAPETIILEASSTGERVGAVRAIREVARAGRTEVLYTGPAFLAPTSRRHVPGTYLDDDLALASKSLALHFARMDAESRSRLASRA